MLWRKEPKVPTQPEGLCSLMASPVLKDGYVYGIGFDGALICLEAETGKEQWQSYALMDGKSTDCGTAFLVKIFADRRLGYSQELGGFLLGHPMLFN